MKFFLKCLLIFLFPPIFAVFAETQNFQYQDNSLKIEIAKEYNQLKFVGASLSEVVGDPTQFVLLSTGNEEVVLQSNLGAGKPLKISVTADNGLTQTLLLLVNPRLPPQKIVINMANFFESSVTQKSRTIFEENTKTFIRHIAEQEPLSQKFVNTRRIFELDVELGKTYKVVLKNGRQLFGQLVRVKNNKSSNVDLEGSRWLQGQKDLRAYFFEKTTLKPKESSYAILVHYKKNKK